MNESGCSSIGDTISLEDEELFLENSLEVFSIASSGSGLVSVHTSDFDTSFGSLNDPNHQPENRELPHSPYSAHGLTAGDLSPNYSFSSDSESISDKGDIHPGPPSNERNCRAGVSPNYKRQPTGCRVGLPVCPAREPRKDGSQLWRCVKEKEEKCNALL
ncbi:hypothetical protein L596_005039 [Steinernema carpocapsae]|uniref:Uncharacterized protein n=1 Tax=Steinernema carpocapsae TaxID=34508 RepID=A0A4U8V1Y3_STECR|nr:hypothetical protein L596_005039 [Steinernema carpocapsae]